MLLRYLETENFLSHEKEQIAFPASGIFLLAGDSGAGKSSFIVDAVAYCLFGTVATRARRQADLLHHSHPGEEMHVRASFDFADGRRITIARGTDSRGSSWAQAYKAEDDGSSKLLAEGVTPVGQLLRTEMGGMTWQQFFSAFVARQSEISMLTTLRGAERKALIQKMLGMRELDKAVELIAARLRRAAAERDQLERSVGEFDLAAEERQLRADRGRAEGARQRIDSLRAEMESARKEQSELEARIRPLRQAAEAAAAQTALQAEKRSLQSAIAGLQKAQERHEEAERSLRTLPALEASLKSLEGKRAELLDRYRAARKLASLLEENESLQTRLSELSASLPAPPGSSGLAIVPALHEARDVAARAGAELDHALKELAEKRDQFRRLQEGGGCYVCGRDFKGEHDHEEVLESLRLAIEELEQTQVERGDEKDWFQQVEPTLSELFERETRAAEIAERIADLEKDGVDTDYESVEQDGRKAAEEIEEARNRIAGLKALRRDLDPDVNGELEKARAELSRLEGESSKAPDLDREKLAGLERQEEILREKLAGLRASIPEAERACTEAERFLRSRSEALAGRKKELETLGELRRRALSLEKLQSLVRAYGKHLAHEIRPALEEIGSEMIRRVSGGRHVAMHIDDDYEVELEESNGSRLAASMLSGGESIRTNICLRLALTRLVSQRTGVPLGFLVLDEPLPSQDPGHIERIMELLESLRAFYPQQFVISHVGELRAADEVDYVLRFGEEKLQLEAS